MFLLLQQNTLTKVEHDGSRVVATSAIVAGLPEDTVTVALLGTSTLYYLRRCNPAELFRAAVGQGSSEHVSAATLPSPCTSLQSSGNKIYCICSAEMVSLDPLSGTLEWFALPDEMVEARPLSTGFVMRARSGRLFTFQFGVGAEPTTCFSTKLLGQVRRLAIARGEEMGALFTLPLEGTCESTQRPPVLTDADLVDGCDDSSGKAVLLTKGGELFVITMVTGSEWEVRNISGFDIQADVEAHLIQLPLADPVDTCNICFDDISEGDAITLDCGHAFHVDCIKECLLHAEKYISSGTRITFNMAMCPGGCGRIVRHPISEHSTAISERYRKVRELAVARAAAEFPMEPPSEVIDRFLYYVCYKCKEPFWGGNKDCAATLGGEPTNDPTQLLCESCHTDFRCSSHGRDFLVYKCRYCCNPATHLSFGTFRLCDRCHTGKIKSERPCPQLAGEGQCCLPAGHATGNAVPIGCFLCLSPEDLNLDRVQQPGVETE